jgi:hypothetical protein
LWDDLNGYFYLPLASIKNGSSVFGPNIPGSLTFMSFHNTSFLTFIGVLLEVKDYKIGYIYKIFNSLNYVINFYFLYLILLKYNSTFFARLCFITIATSSIWFIEVVCNYTDFPVFLLATFAIYRIYGDRKSDLSYGVIIAIMALFIPITLKSLVVIIPLILYELKNKLNIKNLSITLLLPLLALPIFIRNYLLTGNPTFPAGNHFWKSKYFLTDSGNIVVSKYVAPWKFDLSYFFNLLTNSEKSVSIFFGAENYLYNPIFFSIITIYFVTLFYGKLIVYSYTNEFIKFGLLCVVCVILLPGAQYRYFASSIVILNIGFLIAIRQCYDLEINRIKYSFLLNYIYLVLISIMTLTPYSGLPLAYKDQKIISM